VLDSSGYRRGVGGSTNISDGALVSQPREQLVHLRGGRLNSRNPVLAIALLEMELSQHTLRALLRVSSTSKRTMVSLSGRFSRVG
jgi:hypothetical protein